VGSVEEVGAFGLDLVTDKTVDEAVEAISQSLKSRQFAILWDLDIPKKLAEKGLSGTLPFRVLEVCNPQLAHAALGEDALVGYFLPCKVVVYAQAGVTHIGLLRPTTLIGLVQNQQLVQVANDVESTLLSVITEAASS
jgi:uncharacterized protein (DUF302 family)